MHSPWGLVDSLMRELGALRNEARSFDSRTLTAEVAAEVDRCIGEAAQALDEAISAPEDEARLLGVCEAIVAARHQIEALRTTRDRARDLVAQSRDLRRQHARLLYESLRGPSSRNT